MPTYEYECKCGNAFIETKSMSERAHAECPKCGAQADKQMSAPAFSIEMSEYGSVRYYTQLAKKPNDPDAYMTTDQAKRTCDAKGYQWKPIKDVD